MWNSIVSVPEHCLSIYFMKLADNSDRHKISDEFDFQSDWSLTLELLAL